MTVCRGVCLCALCSFVFCFFFLLSLLLFLLLMFSFAFLFFLFIRSLLHRTPSPCLNQIDGAKFHQKRAIFQPKNMMKENSIRKKQQTHTLTHKNTTQHHVDKNMCFIYLFFVGSWCDMFLAVSPSLFVFSSVWSDRYLKTPLQSWPLVIDK